MHDTLLIFPVKRRYSHHLRQKVSAGLSKLPSCPDTPVLPASDPWGNGTSHTPHGETAGPQRGGRRGGEGDHRWFYLMLFKWRTNKRSVQKKKSNCIWFESFFLQLLTEFVILLKYNMFFFFFFNPPWLILLLAVKHFLRWQQLCILLLQRLWFLKCATFKTRPPITDY